MIDFLNRRLPDWKLPLYQVVAGLDRRYHVTGPRNWVLYYDSKWTMEKACSTQVKIIKCELDGRDDVKTGTGLLGACLFILI